MRGGEAASGLVMRGLRLGYDGPDIVPGLDLEIGGGCTALLGPNGSGKSTLLRGLARLLTPRAGGVLLDGRAIATTPARHLARSVALLAQGAAAPDGLDVRSLVGYGRFPYRTPLRGESAQDRAAVAEAMARCGVEALADRPVTALSGGQAQRVWLACAVAQQTPWLLADEPTTYLDLRHQRDVLRLLRGLADAGRHVVMVLHDLNHAVQYADRIVVLDAGRVVADGTPAAVVTPALLRDVYGIDGHVTTHPANGRPLVVPEA